MPDRQLRLVNNIRAIRHARAAAFGPAGPQTQPFSLREVARRTGVNYTTLYRWEEGINRPTKAHSRRLAKALGCRVEELAL